MVERRARGEKRAQRKWNGKQEELNMKFYRRINRNGAREKRENDSAYTARSVYVTD